MLMSFTLTAPASGSVDIDSTWTVDAAWGLDYTTDARFGSSGGASGTVNIVSGGTWNTDGEMRFAENGVAATINVEVGGHLNAEVEMQWNEGEVGVQTNRLNVYGTAYVEQLKMYGIAGDDVTTVGNGTDAATLTVLEGLLGKDGDASITINAGSTMIIAGDWGGALFTVDSRALGTDSYIDLVGGTLIVNALYTSVDIYTEPWIRGYGVAGNWIKTFDAAGFDGDGANIYTPAPLELLWDATVSDNWNTDNWSNDGGTTYDQLPIADVAMVVNGGTVTVSTDVSGAPEGPAGSLEIISLAPATTTATVEIASAGTLAVTGGDPVIADVIVGDGGTLNVNGLLVTGGVNVVNVEVGGTLSLGGGSMVRSTTAESTSNVEVTVNGKLTIDGDGKSYLGDNGQHPDYLGDGDSNATNLTLGDGAAIDWIFGGVGADNDSYLTIKGLTTLGASLTVNIVDGGGSADGDDVYLIRSLGGVVNPAAAVLGDKPAGWTGTLQWVQRSASLWDLQLTALTTGGQDQNPGDTDGNGIVDDTDMANFELAFGLAGAELTVEGFAFDPDFDNDGDADLDDFVTLRESFGNNYNEAPSIPDLSQTPEPATMSLLALGALAVLRRRRRKS